MKTMGKPRFLIWSFCAAVLLGGMAFLAVGVAAWGEAGRGGAWNKISQDAILSVRNDASVRWIAEKTLSADSARERVAFLGEVMAAADDKGDGGSGEKSAALWLLGACGGREAVPVLLANLEWKDEVGHEMPAVAALEGIKGEGFEAFVQEQRAVRGEDVALGLFIHAVD